MASLAIGPGWSRVYVSGITPCSDTRPIVGFSPVRPCAELGFVIDPPVWVPVLDDPRADGLRSTDPSFQLAVHDRLELEVEKRGLEILDLEGIPREDWLDSVESEVHRRLRSPAQLELL